MAAAAAASSAAAASTTKMESCQIDPCPERDMPAGEKLNASANSVIENDSKNIVLVNGVVEDESMGMVKTDISLNIDQKMAELQVTIENELNSFENDEGSPKLNDALTDEQKIELKMILSNYFSHFKLLFFYLYLDDGYLNWLLAPLEDSHSTSCQAVLIVAWFSEYLSKDKFLISQMDYDQFIPISIVAGLEDVKRITQNLTSQNKLDAVVKTLQEIQFVQLSDSNSKVRRIIERSTLLLREIPKSVPEKDIREIFTNDDCPPIIACEYAHNDSWYVHFGSEEDANRAYKFLRESGKLFMNKPILARFKGKSALTGSYIPPQSSEVTASLSAPVSVPPVQNPTSPVIAVPYLHSGYTCKYPEQTLTYYPDLYPGFTLGYNAFPVAACPLVGPMNIFYPASDQTTIEVINNRQRKSYNRGGIHHHSRPDPGTYNNEHKQPPRFSRKRVESSTNEFDEHHSTTTTTAVSHPPTSHTEPHSSVNQMSPSADSQFAPNPQRYTQRRPPNRGGRRSRHQEGGGGGSISKRHGSDGPKPFELETSSFPPLSSGQMADSGHLGKTEAKSLAVEPQRTVVSNRVDQSTTTDGDFENPGNVTAMPAKFSYAQIAKRSVKEDGRSDTAERPPNGTPTPSIASASTAPKASDLNSNSSCAARVKDDVSPKERRGGKPRHRPPKSHNEEMPKETH